MASDAIWICPKCGANGVEYTHVEVCSPKPVSEVVREAFEAWLATKDRKYHAAYVREKCWQAYQAGRSISAEVDSPKTPWQRDAAEEMWSWDAKCEWPDSKELWIGKVVEIISRHEADSPKPVSEENINKMAEQCADELLSGTKPDFYPVVIGQWLARARQDSPTCTCPTAERDLNCKIHSKPDAQKAYEKRHNDTPTDWCDFMSGYEAGLARRRRNDD